MQAEAVALASEPVEISGEAVVYVVREGRRRTHNSIRRPIVARRVVPERGVNCIV